MQTWERMLQTTDTEIDGLKAELARTRQDVCSRDETIAQLQVGYEAERQGKR